MNVLTLNQEELTLVYRILVRQDAASMGVTGSLADKRDANRALDHLRADIQNALHADSKSQNNG